MPAIRHCAGRLSRSCSFPSLSSVSGLLSPAHAFRLERCACTYATRTRREREPTNQKTNSMKPNQIETTVEPKASEVISALIVNEDGSYSLPKGFSYGVRGLVVAAVEKADASASAGVQAVNIIRLARAFPQVEGKDAFALACEQAAALCVSPGAWQNVQSLIACADLKDAWNLPGSVFSVKEAMGYVRKVGLIGDDGKPAAKSKAKSDPVVKALLAGKGVNAIREDIKAAKAAKPDVFPVKGKASETTTTVRTGNTETPPDSNAESNRGTHHVKMSAQDVALAFKTAIGAWDKAIAEGVAVNDLFTACAAELDILTAKCNEHARRKAAAIEAAAKQKQK